MGAVEEATAEAEKHGDRSEPLAALVAEAKGMLEQAKAEKEERARAAAEAAATAKAAEVAAAAAAKAAKAVAAAELLQMEEQMAALAQRMQEVQAQLGVPAATPRRTRRRRCACCGLAQAGSHGVYVRGVRPVAVDPV